MSKIFELCLSEKLNDYLTTSDNQFGFKAKHSTDMCIYAMKSVVKYYNHYESPVYTCFLDASKAFDRIHHWTLFSKLIARGVPCPLILYWYRTQKVCVKWGKLNSSYFGVSNGLRQGGILPPKLFSVYVDELSKKLSAAKTGCIINDISIKLIDICFEYSLHNSLTFNSTKSVCIVFKPKRFKLHCPTMTLNSVPMEYVTDVTYLG